MNTAHASSAAATPEQLPCPRCNSRDTKFCYYNNYNLTQPRHYCRACRRYWTQGGTLRNVPVGGGCRKNKQGVPTDSAKYRPQQMSTEAPFTVWSPNGNSNFSVPVPDAQIQGMGYNGFQLIQSEAAPAHPFQVNVSGFGMQEMNQYAGGYTGNVDAFGDEYEIFDSNNAEFGSVSDCFPVNGSDIGYWNPGSAWDYPTTGGAFP